MKIILASASPRRSELLNMLEVKDLVVCPALAEECIGDETDAAEIVKSLSAQKAREVAKKFAPSDVVIGADTVVVMDGLVLGKPKDEEDAKQMLHRLSGREHVVFTGVTVIMGDMEISEAETSSVRFRDLTAREIDAYVKTGEPMDKAGSYGIQGKGSLFVSGITGDYFNVMGLPLCRLGKILAKLGVELI